MPTNLQVARDELLDVELALLSLPSGAPAAAILVARRAELVAKIARLESETSPGWAAPTRLLTAWRLPVLVLSGLLLLSLPLPWFDFALFNLTGLDVLQIALQAGDITDALRFFFTLSPVLLLALRIVGVLVLVALVVRVATPLLGRSSSLIGVSSGGLLLLPVTTLLMTSPDLLRDLQAGFLLFVLTLVTLVVLDTRGLASENTSVPSKVRSFVMSIGLLSVLALGSRGALDHAIEDRIHLLTAVATLIAAALFAQRSVYATAVAAGPIAALAAVPGASGPVVAAGSVAVTGAFLIGLLSSSLGSEQRRRGPILVAAGASAIALLVPTVLSVSGGVVTSLRERGEDPAPEPVSAVPAVPGAPTAPDIRELPQDLEPQETLDSGPSFDFTRAPTRAFSFAGVGDAGIESGLALVRGILYLADNYGRLYAIDAMSGTLEWRIDVGGPVWSPLTVDEDRLLLSEGEGELVVVDMVGRSVIDRWRIGTSTPTMLFGHSHGETDGELVVTTVQGSVQVRDIATGVIRWQVDLGERLSWKSATVHDGLVLVAADRGTIHALDLRDGSRLWRFPTGGFDGPDFAFFEDSILALGYNSTLYSIDRHTGTEQWRQPVERWNFSTITVTDDLVLAGGENHLHAFDVRDGRPEWIAPLAPAGTFHHPTTLLVVDDVVLVNAQDGLVGLRLSDGSLLWRSGIPTWMEPVLADGMLYVKSPGVGGVVALEFPRSD